MITPKYDSDLFPHWVTMPMRYRDLDPLNHVNNAIFSTYYEEARIAFIQEVPELVEQVQAGYGFVLAKLEIKFIKPAKFPGELLVGSGIKQIGNSSLTSFQAIYRSDSKELLSVGEAVGVWFDTQHQRPAKFPEFEGRERYLLDPGLE